MGVTFVEPNEEDRLRILLAHVVSVLEAKAPAQIERCEICSNAVAASKVPPTAGHRPGPAGKAKHKKPKLESAK